MSPAISYGLDPRQFAVHVVYPALRDIGLWSQAAGALVLGTAMQESRLRYLRQMQGGPALGLFQMEPATFRDIRDNFLASNSTLRLAVNELARHSLRTLEPAELVGNLHFAAAMCRVHYRRVKAPLPLIAAGSLEFARYWKRYYNTEDGKGTADEALPHFTRAIKIISAASSAGELE